MKPRLMFLAAILMLLALPSRADSAEFFTVGDFEYQLIKFDDGSITVNVAKYNGTDKDVTVPPSVISPSGKEYPVKGVRFDAFHECRFLESVSLPNSIELLSNSAFEGCSSLKSINIPENVANISSNCFRNCTALKSITIPNSVLEIGYEAFEGCESLTEVQISNSVKSLERVFKKCTSLSSIVIPNSVTNIDMAFSGCTTLTSVNIPNSVISMTQAFNGCTSLASIEIPNSVKSMAQAFGGCTSLTSIEIPNSVISMGYAFNGCKSLTSVTLQKGLKEIGIGTFQNCESLKSLTIPASVDRIGSTAFTGCSSLREFIVNDGSKHYKSIKGLLYEYSVDFYGMYYYGLLSCPGAYEGSCELQESTTTIYSYAFEGCSHVTSVTMPKTMQVIYGHAFSGCTSLKEITVWNPTPPVLKEVRPEEVNTVFTDVPADAVVYVPAGAAKRYSETDGWNYFHDFRELDGVAIYLPDLTLSVGETKPIAVEISTPEGISIVSKLWWSYDTEVATIDENGNVTAVSPGNCQILFMSTDSNGVEYMNFCIVHVKEPSAIDDITIDNATPKPFDIYNLQGICLKRKATKADIESLTPGLYIINGKKVLIR